MRSPFQRQQSASSPPTIRHRSTSRSPRLCSRFSPWSTSAPPGAVVFNNVFEQTAVLSQPSSPRGKTSFKWAGIGIMRKIEDKVLDLCFSKSASMRSCPEPEAAQSSQGEALEQLPEAFCRAVSAPSQSYSSSLQAQFQDEPWKRSKKRPNINYFNFKPASDEDRRTRQVLNTDSQMSGG